VVAFTDGLSHAGERSGHPMDIPGSFQQLIDEENPSPDWIADSLLREAVRLDDERPVDDISVVVIHVSEYNGDAVRRMNVRFPLNS